MNQNGEEVEARNNQADVEAEPQQLVGDGSGVTGAAGADDLPPDGVTEDGSPYADYPQEAEEAAPSLSTEEMSLYPHTDLGMEAPPAPTDYAGEAEADEAPQAYEEYEPGADGASAVEDAAPAASAAATQGAEAGRESMEGFEQTAPLGRGVKRDDLRPVGVSELIDDRYMVQNVLHHSSERNLYRVVAHNQQRCYTCGRLSGLDATTCATCGSPLAGSAPADFYLMAESYRPDALMQDPALMDLKLYHPNLVPVIDFFSASPNARTRYYAVAEPRQGVRLSQLSMPRSGLQVLNWATQLADALDYLHSRGVVGAGAEADDILVQGERASLASLQNARAAVGEGPERTELQSLDLARLAGTIYEAYTGNQATMSPEGTLAMPGGTPEPVGAAFRAAIEPVQGAARAITAAQWRDLLSTAMQTLDELERPGKPVDFVSAGLTDVGRLREQNQDSFGMAEFVQASAERPMRIGFYMIADGLGGHKGGEIASALAVQAFSGEVVSRIISPLAANNADRSTPTNEAILQAMTRGVQLANDRIYKARDSRRNDMGTTLVAAVLAGGKAYIVNVGDSRLYLYSRPRTVDENVVRDATRPLIKGTSPLSATAPLRSREAALDMLEHGGHDEIAFGGGSNSGYALQQVSIDHSLVHRLVELGQLDAEEAKVHPHRNFIYRSLGGPPPIEVDTFVRTLHPGDRLLLCSDGLNSMIEDSDIEDVLSTESDPHAACQKLIDLANSNGGHDNITVVLVDVTDYLPLPEHPNALLNS